MFGRKRVRSGDRLFHGIDNYRDPGCHRIDCRAVPDISRNAQLTVDFKLDAVGYTLPYRRPGPELPWTCRAPACAMRSAAASSGLALESATTRVSVGPYIPSIPTSPYTARLAAVTHTFPGPQILSTAGTVSVPVSHRRDGLRAPDLENSIHTSMRRCGKDVHVRQLVARRRGTQYDLPHTGHAGRHDRHQDRRRQRRSTSRHVRANRIDWSNNFPKFTRFVAPALGRGRFLKGPHPLQRKLQRVPVFT